MVLKSFFCPLIVGLALLPASVGFAQNRAAPLDFQGRYLVSISDADMLASAYVNGRLGPREGQDSLSVIPLGGHARDLQAYEVPASNSVAGPPVAVTVTPDGRYALVIETFKPRPEGNWENQTFADLRHGDRLQVFDLTDPTQPMLVQDVAIAERPDSISINRDGSLIAVSFHPNGAGRETPLALIPFSDGQRQFDDLKNSLWERRQPFDFQIQGGFLLLIGIGHQGRQGVDQKVEGTAMARMLNLADVF